MKRKSDLVAALADKTGLRKTDVASVIDALTDIVVDGLKDEEECILTGLGKFKIGHRSERVGRNPQTGDKVTIPAQKTVKFAAGKPLKDAVK
ncbi:DNA-binding protein HU [Halomonas sp. LBP4]|nr:HU family DNA-binding protein [Halomonas sp. LBP4]PXX94672.1 DNA-binding protein HU [Halomonas sp. LBP4]